MEKSNKKVFGFPKTSIGLCGAVLGTALIASVAVGTNASADEVSNAQANNTTNATVTTVASATTTTQNNEAPKEIPSSVENVTQSEAVDTVNNAQSTLASDVKTAQDKGVTVNESTKKEEVVINDDNATEKTNEVLADLKDQDQTVKNAQENVEAVDKKAEALATSTANVDQVKKDADKAGVPVTVTTTDSKPEYTSTEGLSGKDLRDAQDRNTATYESSVDSAIVKQNAAAKTAKEQLDAYNKAYTDYKNGVVSSTGLTWSNGVQLEAGQGAQAMTGNEQVIDWSDGTLKSAAKYATQGTDLSENKDATFDSIFKIDGTGTVNVKNTTKGDVALTFSNIVSSGATSNYVALWGAPNGGISWSVFGLVNGANTGGGIGEGASGSGGAGNVVLTHINSYDLGVETSDSVSVFTFNDIDNDQTISNLQGVDSTTVETGSNVTSGQGSYGAGPGDVSQASGHLLDSNSVRWIYKDSKPRKISLNHATSGNNTSIVAGIFGEDSNIPVEPKKPSLALQKVTVSKPSVEVTVHYYEMKETPKPETPVVPETPQTPVVYTPETRQTPTYQAPAQLPQTGESETKAAVAIGISSLLIAAGLTVSPKQKRH